MSGLWFVLSSRGYSKLDFDLSSSWSAEKRDGVALAIYEHARRSSAPVIIDDLFSDCSELLSFWCAAGILRRTARSIGSAVTESDLAASAVMDWIKNGFIGGQQVAAAADCDRISDHLQLLEEQDAGQTQASALRLAMLRSGSELCKAVSKYQSVLTSRVGFDAPYVRDASRRMLDASMERLGTLVNNKDAVAGWVTSAVMSWFDARDAIAKTHDDRLAEIDRASIDRRHAEHEEMSRRTTGSGRAGSNQRKIPSGSAVRFDPMAPPSLDRYGMSKLLDRVMNYTIDGSSEALLPASRSTIDLCGDMPVVRLLVTDLQMYEPDDLERWLILHGRPAWPSLEHDLWIQKFAKKTGARKVESHPSRLWKLAHYPVSSLGRRKSEEEIFEMAREALGGASRVGPSATKESARDTWLFPLLACASKTTWELQYPLDDVRADSRDAQRALGAVWRVFESLRYPAYDERECRHIAERDAFQKPIQRAMSEAFFPWLFQKATDTSSSGVAQGSARGPAIAALGAAIGAAAMRVLKPRG